MIPHTAILEMEIMEEVKTIQVAQIYDQKENPMNGRVYDTGGIAPTLRTPTGGLYEPKIVVSCALRGRNPENPSDRRAGTPTEQRLELGGDVANCLTSVQKDSMVVEPLGLYDNHLGEFFREPIEGLARTLKADHHNAVLIHYRIRKLTERECFRLMDVDDADIDKIDAYRIRTTLKDGTVKEKPIPKSQKYKMAGNSIVVGVLYHIFYQMFIAEPPKPEPRQLTFDFGEF